jgi:hypothetical protein
MLITRCFPAFLLILSEETSGLGQCLFQDSSDSERSCYSEIDIGDSEYNRGVYEPPKTVATLLELFKELTEDSNFMIRYSCQMVFSKMTEIAKS